MAYEDNKPMFLLYSFQRKEDIPLLSFFILCYVANLGPSGLFLEGIVTRKRDDEFSKNTKFYYSRFSQILAGTKVSCVAGFTGVNDYHESKRLDCSMSVLEVRGNIHDFERFSIVHRLGKQHGPDFSMSLSENRSADAIANHGPPIRKPPPQKYVIAVPMPRTLPEESNRRHVQVKYDCSKT
ncbi:hypothetical protein L7F22_064009 [Adiantum nelumboides]|nr:hypothetical protein [Adiantum nelumboides]